MKGVILAGDLGTFDHRFKGIIPKPLLLVHDKPMIFYPLHMLISSGIKEILIISHPHEMLYYESLLGDGRRWGVSLKYIGTPFPDGISRALFIGANFIGSDDVCVTLADRIFYGNSIKSFFAQKAEEAKNGKATILSSSEDNISKIETILLNNNEEQNIGIEEDSEIFEDKLFSGLFFFPKNVIEKLKDFKILTFGHLPITSILKDYKKNDMLEIKSQDTVFKTLKTNSYEEITSSAQFLLDLKRFSGISVACMDEYAKKERLKPNLVADNLQFNMNTKDQLQDSQQKQKLNLKLRIDSSKNKNYEKNDEISIIRY
ncbi:MAG: sugar phosphate nucleotidyltransferase [Draconibacterium sp.]